MLPSWVYTEGKYSHSCKCATSLRKGSNEATFHTTAFLDKLSKATKHPFPLQNVHCRELRVRFSGPLASQFTDQGFLLLLHGDRWLLPFHVLQ